MIAMSMLSTYGEYRRDTLPRAPTYPAPASPVRRAILLALARLGLGAGGVAATYDDETLGIG